MIGVAATQGCPLEAADYSHGRRAVNGIRAAPACLRTPGGKPDRGPGGPLKLAPLFAIVPARFSPGRAAPE